jgi:hypothetical protein
VEFREEGLGVEKEVREWAEAMGLGRQNLRMSPEEAYRDLLVVRTFSLLLGFECVGRTLTFCGTAREDAR